MAVQSRGDGLRWLPVAGLNVSGLGVGDIPHTLRDMQAENMLVIRSEEL